MKKIKRIRARLKRLFKEFEAYDRINDGRLSSAILAALCFLLLILIGLCVWIFG